MQLNKFIFILILLTNILSCTSEKYDNFTEGKALVISRNFVKDRLKSPASAEFDQSFEGVKKINDTIFHVSSFVDSQNGFGAMIRSKYSCTIIFNSVTEMATCENLIIQ